MFIADHDQQTMQAVKKDNGVLGGKINPEPETTNNSVQFDGVVDVQEDKMWIWKELLARVQWRISQLERRLDKKAKLYHQVQNKIKAYERVRVRVQHPQVEHGDNLPQFQQMARIIVLVASALNLSEQLALNIADYSKECCQIRRKLEFLEAQLNRDPANDAGLGHEKPDPLQVALDYMSRVDKMLTRIFQWDEEEGA